MDAIDTTAATLCILGGAFALIAAGAWLIGRFDRSDDGKR